MKSKPDPNWKNCPAPPNFRPAEDIITAEFSREAPPFIRPGKFRARGRRADGLRYERRGQEWLTAILPYSYVASPWFKFKRRSPNSAWAWCQPDGLDIDIRRGLITIVEFKLQHTSKAWWQTRRLYEPVVRELFHPSIWEFAIVEIVRWFDPDVAFPEKFTFVSDITKAVPGGFHIHIWNGR